MRVRVGSASPCIGLDTDAVCLRPPRWSQEFLRPPLITHHSPSVHTPTAHGASHILYRTAVRCGCALRAAHQTKTPRPPAGCRARVERLFASPWVGGLLASRHESNGHRVASGEMPVHQDHQGKAPSTFVLRAHQLLLFVATLHQLGTWVQGFGMRIDAQRAGAEASLTGR